MAPACSASIEVVRNRQIDGHRHGAGAVGLVAAVNGDGLIVHGIQSLLLVKPSTSWHRDVAATACQGQGARPPTSSNGYASTKSGSRWSPMIARCRLSRSRPVLRGHAVERQDGQFVPLVPYVAPQRRGGTHAAGWRDRTRDDPAREPPSAAPTSRVATLHPTPSDCMAIVIAGVLECASCGTVLVREWGRTISGSNPAAERMRGIDVLREDAGALRRQALALDSVEDRSAPHGRTGTTAAWTGRAHSPR